VTQAIHATPASPSAPASHSCGATARQAPAPEEEEDTVVIKVRSRKLALDVNYVGTLASTFWPVGEFIARVGGGVWTIGNGIAEGTKAMTAHENTAGHTSSAANRPFIAYMRSANARPRTELLVVLLVSLFTPLPRLRLPFGFCVVAGCR
jgi:hypothetical protein